MSSDRVNQMPHSKKARGEHPDPDVIIREPLPVEKSVKNRYYLYLAICLYAFELFLAGIFNGSWVARVPLFQTFTRLMESVIPMIGHFDRIALHPEGLRVYLSLTWLLLPLKAFFIYQWLMADEMKNYRHFIISPRARQKNMSNYDFIRDAIPNRKEDKPIKQRSLLATAFWSIMIVLFGFGFVYVLTFYGTHIPLGKSSGLRSLDIKDNLMALGGMPAWVVWSCMQTSVIGGSAAVPICVIRDWVEFFKECLRR